jgi:hypothetical protein
MLPGQFLRRLPTAARAYLPTDDGAAQLQARGRLLKVWYGEEAAIHYEIWMHERSLQMEIGLHCEASPELNAAIRRGLSFYLFDIKGALGNGVELEDWDRGWTRLYETLPLYPLDEARVDEIARRLGEFVTVVQPIYMEVRRALPVPF